LEEKEPERGGVIFVGGGEKLGKSEEGESFSEEKGKGSVDPH